MAPRGNVLVTEVSVSEWEDRDDWANEPAVYASGTLLRGKHAPTWVIQVVDGLVHVKATRTTAAILSWSGLLHALSRAAAMSPQFAQAARRVLDTVAPVVAPAVAPVPFDAELDGPVTAAGLAAHSRGAIVNLDGDAVWAASASDEAGEEGSDVVWFDGDSCDQDRVYGPYDENNDYNSYEVRTLREALAALAPWLPPEPTEPSTEAST